MKALLSKKNALSVFLAFSLVVAALGSPVMVQPAAATHDCSTTDALVFGFSFGFVNEDKCTNNHVYHAVKEVRDAETAQDKLDIYAAMSGSEAQKDTFESTYDNYLQDSEAVAWMKVEATVAEAYKNGSTKAEAKVAAKEAIQAYYATKQINLIESWNTSLTSFNYSRERAIQEGFNTGSASDYVLSATVAQGAEPTSAPATWDHPTGVTDHGGYWDVTGLTNTTVTLTNGTAHGSVAATFGPSFDGSAGEGPVHVHYGAVTDDDETPQFWAYGLFVRSPQSGYEQIRYVNFLEYERNYNKIDTKSDNLINESDLFVDAIWTDLGDGSLNATDIISRTTLMFEYGTASQNGTSMYNVIGAAAGMGLETPTMNGTGTMTVSYQGTTYEGILFARAAPNGSWTANTTYDAAAITGPVMLGTTSGRLMELKGTFYTKGFTAEDGTELQSVNTTKYVYKTANTSELQAQMDALLNLTAELQARSEAVGTGGSSSSSGLTTNHLLIGAAVLGVVLLAGEGNKRRRY